MSLTMHCRPLRLQRTARFIAPLPSGIPVPDRAGLFADIDA
jgi:hypothetical protein